MLSCESFDAFLVSWLVIVLLRHAVAISATNRTFQNAILLSVSLHLL